jgi:hypothetical protein
MEGEQVASEIQEKVGGRSGEWAQGVAGGEEGAVLKKRIWSGRGKKGEISLSPLMP